MHALARLALCGISLLAAPSEAAALIAPAQPRAAAGLDKPFLELEIADAYARAESQGKLLLMFFHSDGESESRQMIKQTFADPRVLAWIEKHAIAIQLDELKHRALLSRFRVARFPCTQLRTADKRLLERMDFFHSADEFLAAAKATLAGRSVNARPEGEASIDPYAWLAWGNYLFNNEGDPTEMVRAYRWCLEQGDRHEPGFRSRYLEFLLKRVAFAKRSTPEALLALTTERNRLRGLVNSAAANDVQAHELVLFNFWMREEEDSRKTFLELAGKNPATESLRRVLLYHELEGLVAHRHYTEIREHLPSPVAEIRQRLKRMKEAEERAAKMEKPVDLGFVVHGLPEARSQWVGDASNFYEVLLHEGMGGDAAELLDMVVSEVPTGRAFALFMDKSTRLGLDELTRRTAERGMQEVREGGAKKIKTALMRLEQDQSVRAADAEAAAAAKQREEDGKGGDDH